MKQHKESNNSKPLDRVDNKIIQMLQKDGSLTNTDIAKKLEVSEATVRTRLKRLLEEGYIQIVAVSNPYKLGFGLTGDVYITVEPDKIKSVAQELKKLKELWFIVITTDKAAINAEYIVRSREELNDLVNTKISSIEGVHSVETSVILEYIKRRYDYGTAMYQ